MVRRATTQTVLVTENGSRQVVKRREPVIVRANDSVHSVSATEEDEPTASKTPAAKRTGKVRSPRRSAKQPSRRTKSKTPLSLGGEWLPGAKPGTV